jgi:hypothetical protein
MRLLFLVSFLISLAGCSTVKSVVPGMGSSDTPSAAKAGEKLHFKMTPEEALTLLGEVAAQNGWQVVSSGDQYDMQGLRGKYFRIETERFIGGTKEMSGIFFSEPTGTYVVVGKNDSGLPEGLTGPFIAAAEERTKATGGP